MNPVAALIIDDVLVNWVLGTATVVTTTVIPAMYLGWRKFIAFIAPQIRSAFKSHIDLINTLQRYTPQVHETLTQISNVQNEHSQMLNQTNVHLAQTSAHLGAIIEKVSRDSRS